MSSGTEKYSGHGTVIRSPVTSSVAETQRSNEETYLSTTIAEMGDKFVVWHSSTEELTFDDFVVDPASTQR